MHPYLIEQLTLHRHEEARIWAERRQRSAGLRPTLWARLRSRFARPALPSAPAPSAAPATLPETVPAFGTRVAIVVPAEVSRSRGRVRPAGRVAPNRPQSRRGAPHAAAVGPRTCTRVAR